MCFDVDALPPLPPVRGGATDHGPLRLRSADGTEFLASYAHPDQPSSKGVVILPDVRGLHPFYEDLAPRFADAGAHAVAIDYFGRTAGTAPRPEDFPFREHVGQMKPQQVDEDVAAAVAWLRGLASGTVTSVFTVGFCLGGAMSWRQSAAGHGLRGCVGFYGRPDRVTDVVAKMKAPLLLLAAGQDHTPVSAVEELAAAVPVEAEVHVYPAAPHSFFDRRFEEHQEACEDAWQRILAFFDRLS
ncbi:MAG: dienelactone hydrolase family protein [Acidimicrobiales bacterium]